MTLFQQTPGKFRFTALVAVLALVYAVWLGGAWWQWAIAVGGYFVYGCLGIVVGFHRLLSHRSFEVAKWKEYALVILGHLAGTGSAISWVALHIEHHRHSDTSLDPHTPRNGVFNMLTLGYRHPNKSKSRWVLRLARDPLYRALHNYYLLVHVAVVGSLYAAFGISGVLFGHLVPIAFVVLGSGIANLLGHTIGTQRYDTRDDSTNSFLAALLTWGEGWHNNHHKYPGRPNFGEKWWEVDVAAYVIALLCRYK